MPKEELENRFSTQWQKIGFQGKDPSTDFRAMGLLALDNLYYFAEKYNENAQRILKASNKQVCINFMYNFNKYPILGVVVLFCHCGHQCYCLLLEIGENKKFAVDFLLLRCNKRNL